MLRARTLPGRAREHIGTSAPPPASAHAPPTPESVEPLDHPVRRTRNPEPSPQRSQSPQRGIICFQTQHAFLPGLCVLCALCGERSVLALALWSGRAPRPCAVGEPTSPPTTQGRGGRNPLDPCRSCRAQSRLLGPVPSAACGTSLEIPRQARDDSRPPTTALSHAVRRGLCPAIRIAGDRPSK
jgi:hypothetical protein